MAYVQHDWSAPPFAQSSEGYTSVYSNDFHQSVPGLLTESSTSTGGASSAHDMQEQPQSHMALSLYHPQPLHHASLSQSSLWMLDAQGLNNAFQQQSLASFEAQINQGFRGNFLSVDVIKEVKVDAYEQVVRLIFDTSFSPTNEAAMVKTMAKSALDDVISQYSNAELVKWKTLTEGQAEIQRLSKVLNVIQDKFKDLSLNSIIGQPLPVDFQAQMLSASGYCQQMDTHLTQATVREVLPFSAQLCQPQTVPIVELAAYINKCLVICSLEDYTDAVVGTSGVELAAKPGHFLIHQPSGELFQVFDHLLLLKKGG
ncbi:uncharacterized protein BJ212DRAFT_1480240 [Suillus subaureus]|uniref:Uncharacterized protein n=1 Tax=Suillus subaureus TaxID=48587 RepID=A0A9P7JEH9_9AGAM|nr:uncharacterized protein BJ212DRAFT_1480240 [Suillus subaureus]KAG1817687.1 hypothetical protein BJ212DRAFT_1480240 [Suillus subaureus]